MKNYFLLMSLGSVTVLSAAYYQQSPYYNPSCPGGNCTIPSYYQQQSAQQSNQKQENNAPAENNPRPVNPTDYPVIKDNNQVNPATPPSPKMNNPTSPAVQPAIQPSNTKASSKDWSDRDIERAISDMIRDNWHSHGNTTISFEVNKGIVTLHGNVPKAEDRNAIEEAIRQLGMVKGIDNRITIAWAKASDTKSRVNALMAANNPSPKTWTELNRKYPQDSAATEADRRINSDIRGRLNGWFGMDYNAAVILRTTNGLVIVSGTVENADDIHTLTDQIKRVNGVKSVNTQVAALNK